MIGNAKFKKKNSRMAHNPEFKKVPKSTCKFDIVKIYNDKIQILIAILTSLIYGVVITFDY